MFGQGLSEVILVGNLVAAPEMAMVGETPKTKIRIAVNEGWTDSKGEKQEHTSFFNVTVWGGRAKACADYLEQGQQVIVTGRLRQERFPDKDTGENVSYIHIVAREVTFGDKPKKKGEEIQMPEDAGEELPF